MSISERAVLFCGKERPILSEALLEVERRGMEAMRAQVLETLSDRILIALAASEAYGGNDPTVRALQALRESVMSLKTHT